MVLFPSTGVWNAGYTLRFLSDFHAGAGVTLITGNIHGLRLDDQNQPYLPGSQIRGLLRQSGYRLKELYPKLEPLFWCNFPDFLKDHQGFARQSTDNWEVDDNHPFRGWSFTRASCPEDPGLIHAGLWTHQAHIQVDGVVQNLFAYQKAGAVKPGEPLELKGRMYSYTPAAWRDVCFLLACMKLEDRVGHRRSRGYGHVNWTWDNVQMYRPNEAPQVRNPESIDSIIADLLKKEDGHD